MKLQIKFKRDNSYKTKDHIALMSNIDSGNENAFYCLMVYHKSKKGGFDANVSIETLNKGLKKINSDYYYTEV